MKMPLDFFLLKISQLQGQREKKKFSKTLCRILLYRIIMNLLTRTLVTVFFHFFLFFFKGISIKNLVKPYGKFYNIN